MDPMTTDAPIDADMQPHFDLPAEARRALAESEDRYRRATSAGRVGVWDWDIPSNLVTWCPTTHELHGVRLDEFDGNIESFTRLIHPDDAAAMSLLIHEAIAAGTGFEATFRIFRRSDGELRWLWTRSEAVLGPTGAPIRMTGATADVTDRIGTEEALRASELRLRLALQTVPLSIFYLAPSLVITEVVNPPAGMTSTDYVGRTDPQVYGIEASLPLVALKRRVLESRVPGREEIWLPIAGERRCFVMSVEPNYAPNGDLLGLVDAAYEVTDLKKAEADNKAAMEALRLADRRKDEFLALLAHELRNPLAPINSSTEYLKMRGGLDDEALWALDIIGNQVSHLSRLVDDLLDVARITQNRIELRRELITLRDVALAAIETCRPAIEAAGHKLEVDLSPEPIFVDADFARLNQVLQNLLLNASKYTAGPGSITLRTLRRGNRAVAEISDTGIGISSEHIDSIFELFVQADTSSVRAQSGLGIGLTLVKRLVEMHGGKVSASSSGLGHGSTFTVELPAAGSPDNNSKNAMNEPSASARKTVLIVDDNRDAADVLGKMIEFLGNDVRVVYSGEEALDTIHEFKPDIVFMDLGMPNMDGYEAAGKIRSSGDAPQARLVALTGWGQDEAKERTRAAGFHHHVVKPVSLVTLTEILRD